MRVFVPGASGFIGSAVVKELIGAGHEVRGLARSETAANVVHALGAEVLRGSLEDLQSVSRGAAEADGVIMLAFGHGDMSKMAESATAEAGAIEAIAKSLEGTGRPLVVATGVAGIVAGKAASIPKTPSPMASRHAGLRAALAAANKNVRASFVGLPPFVHGVGDGHGFMPRLISIAREKKVSAFIGDGANRWPAVHRLDAARLFRLALEFLPAGAAVHAIGDEGVPLRAVAEAIGRKLDAPTTSISHADAAAHFGWLAGLLSRDLTGTAAPTHELVSWQAQGPALIEDLDAGHYFG